MLSANTPGTTRDREHSLVVSLNSAQQTAAVKAHAPGTHFDAKGTDEGKSENGRRRS